MEVRFLDIRDKYWNKTIEMAENCSWRAGSSLGRKMRAKEFQDFEGVFVAIEEEKVIGFCTITKTDYIPNCVYTPWIGFIFVDEKYRGNRISEKIIKKALEYAKTKGSDKVYISTQEDNLYEKYGFKQIDSLKSYGDTLEKILVFGIK
ncbi:GNAT family N-acetyltransferase [Clostridium cellulovorans]|uniref:GCN5-related N-acetyltransferase n=1 Tax=Clostridium cellulovorans (strain ATCC 35296 / DSM 3052 / OCM 3 / 743B) TaxID=573061 RepID=D9SVR7_CLOC7|nr:GNAT family N-acetyltransferase [Clostridium cellulovorans]ADL53128.1 GCN5-related N-acetyltransferase [Clostridium cellulovorans 743B]